MAQERNTQIKGGQVADGTLGESKLDITNAPIDGYFLEFNGTNFTWQPGIDAVTETPTGLINSVNGTYTLTNTPQTGSLVLFLNGLHQEEGAGKDFQLSGSSITFVTAPDTGDQLIATYYKLGVGAGSSVTSVNGASGVVVLDTDGINEGATNLYYTEGRVSANTDVAANTSAKHTHANKALLDTYTQTEVNLADAVSKKHNHANQALLDTYTQTEANIADAVSKKHTQNSDTSLDFGQPNAVTAAELRAFVDSKAANSGLASLDAGGKVPSGQLPASVVGSLTFQGTWNAATNTPTLGNLGVGGVTGDYYVVSTLGTTSIDGNAAWQVGDWLVHNGSTWDKVDNSDKVSSVNGATGVVVLDTSDISEVTNLYYTEVRVSANTDVAANTSARHTHANSALLASYSQTEVDLADAVTKKHSQNTDTGLGVLASNIDMGTNSITNANSITLSGTIGDGTESSSVANSLTSSIGVVFDGNSNVLSQNDKVTLTIPFSCKITEVRLAADQSGSIVITPKSSNYATFPTTSNIAGASLPTLSSSQKSLDSTLTGWTTALSAGDMLDFEITSVPVSVTRVLISLTVVKT